MGQIRRGFLWVIALINLPLAAQSSSFTIAVSDPIPQTMQGRARDFPEPIPGGGAPYPIFIYRERTGANRDFARGVNRSFANRGSCRRLLPAGSLRGECIERERLRPVSDSRWRADCAAERNSREFLRPSAGTRLRKPGRVFSANDTLPPGFLMNTLRRLVAAPTAAGTYGFTLHARNTLEAKTTNREYLFTVDGPVSLRAKLPNGFVDSAHSAPLVALGGTAPYT